MISNGLISKYYLENKAGNHGVTFDVFMRMYDSLALRIKDDSRFGSGRYYFKACDNSHQVDAEVLLSQVYAKLFNYDKFSKDSTTTFKTALYLPATLREQSGREFHGVISDDVIGKKGQKSIVTKHCCDNFYERDRMNFYYEKRQENIEKGIRNNGYFYGDFVLYKTLHGDKSKITQHFTFDAGRQMVLMRACSVATFDEDRYTGNMDCNFDRHKNVTGISLFDYSWSGDAYLEHLEYCGDAQVINNTFGKTKSNDRITKQCVDLYGKNRTYFNEFCPFERGNVLTVNQKTRDEMVDNFKHNDSVREYFSKQELAETLGSVDVKATAHDIENTIGYKVDEGYVDTIAESFERLAEEVSAP